MSSLINFSIKNAQGGYDKYTMSVNDKQDDYGNNASIFIQQSKEDREAKVKKNFVGSGKVAWTDGKIVKAEFVERTESKPTGMTMQSTSSKLSEIDDLPF
jgi:hypothetical protein